MATRTSKQIAEEAREAFAKDAETPEQHFNQMIQAGFINARGQVTKLLGGTAEPEQGAPTSPPPWAASH